MEELINWACCIWKHDPIIKEYFEEAGKGEPNPEETDETARSEPRPARASNPATGYDEAQ